MDTSFPVMLHSNLEVTHVVEEACSFDAEMYLVCLSAFCSHLNLYETCLKELIQLSG